MNKHLAFLSALAITAGLNLNAQNVNQLTVQTNKIGAEIQPTMYGHFFEDINFGADGGLYAELVKNRSFEFPQNLMGWDTFGNVTLQNDGPFERNPHYVRLGNPGHAHKRTGIENEGFFGIGIKADESYRFSVWARGENQKIRVELIDNASMGETQVITSKDLTVNSKEWKKYEVILTPKATFAKAHLRIFLASSGTVDLEHVSLFPVNTWKNRENGLRKDLVQALLDTKPGIFRFPGGCIVEGTDIEDRYQWKNSVGPVEERIGFRNHWGYWTSQYIGFYEYLLMAESLGATPLPVLNNGVTCQFAGHSYVAPLDTEEDRQRFNDIFVDDALDFIEFCNGGTDTEWGALRAEMGHPEPFNLKYLSIGNENAGEEFWDRFDIIYKAVREAHPEITIVTTAGAFDSGAQFDANMHEIDNRYPDTIVDEHYYKSDEWFYTNTDRYAPGMVRGSDGFSYDRSRPTRVFVGEFANSQTNNVYASAMAEAAYWLSLERNSDMVVMAAYAPLFCKKGFNKWNSNLIWFDNRGLWRTANYYYQQLFSEAGDRAFGISDVMDGRQADTTVHTSPTIDTATGEIYVKFVNSEAVDKIVTVKTGSGTVYEATLEFMSSHDTSVKNQGDQNYYSSHPDYSAYQTMSGPDAGERPGLREMARRMRRVNYLEAVVPHTKELGTVRRQFEFRMPENSVGVLRLTPVD